MRISIGNLSALLDPIPPGEILLEEFLKPLGITQRKLAADLDLPISRISEIVRGKRVIATDTALRLGEYLGTGPKFWLNLQADYDLRISDDEGSTPVKSRIQALKAPPHSRG